LIGGRPLLDLKICELSQRAFMTLLQSGGGRFRYQAFVSFVVASKLKYLKGKLKVWNKEIFEDIKVKKHELLDLIKSLDLKEESFGLSSEELKQRSEAKADWAKVFVLEEIS